MRENEKEGKDQKNNRTVLDCWRMLIRISTIFRPWDYVFPQCMDQLAVRIWCTLASPISCVRGIRVGVLPEYYDFEAHKELVSMQSGEVPVTYADMSALERDFRFKPSTS